MVQFATVLLAVGILWLFSTHVGIRFTYTKWYKLISVVNFCLSDSTCFCLRLMFNLPTIQVHILILSNSDVHLQQKTDQIWDHNIFSNRKAIVLLWLHSPPSTFLYLAVLGLHLYIANKTFPIKRWSLFKTTTYDTTRPTSYFPRDISGQKSSFFCWWSYLNALYLINWMNAWTL